MGVFSTKGFARFARRAGIADATLREAAAHVMAGRPDADLGSGVFKQRVARAGGGKSGGFRTIILFRRGGHCFFVHGFAKNQTATISGRELAALKLLANVLLEYREAELAKALDAGELIEVRNGDEG